MIEHAIVSSAKIVTSCLWMAKAENSTCWEMYKLITDPFCVMLIFNVMMFRFIINKFALRCEDRCRNSYLMKLARNHISSLKMLIFCDGNAYNLRCDTIVRYSIYHWFSLFMSIHPQDKMQHREWDSMIDSSDYSPCLCKCLFDMASCFGITFCPWIYILSVMI
jgi:hypothetical protein